MEISPNSTVEKDIILASLRELEDGEDKYYNLIDDAVNSQVIEEISGEVNRGHSGMMPPPPPPVTPSVKYVKNDELMSEVLDYSTSPVESEQWATALQQWLEACYFGNVSPSSFFTSLINRLDTTWKRQITGLILPSNSPNLIWTSSERRCSRHTPFL